METQKTDESAVVDSHQPVLDSTLLHSSPRDQFHVVGIGASAGGLEALEQFFENTPADSPLCFVVVQHLSPDFKSMMDELLARRTRIPIVRVEDGTEIQPNHIYLMPPRKEMILSGGRLFLTDKDPAQGFALPIDRFLRSLAQDCGSRSVGVILSGTGSDGSRGVRDIHAAGGLVVAQSEESAKFDGMPRSARETGLVDLVLPAADMPDSIVKVIRLRRSPALDEDQVTVPEMGLQAIFRMLRNEYGIDFSQYKPSTVTRRVERRLLFNQSLDVERYVSRLSQDGEELNHLYKDLLIGVTQFFRDKDAFHRLRTDELPRLLSQVGEDEEFRVWVAGCATGEEAYSLAILIDEHLMTMDHRPTIRIFATDAHRVSLDAASTGIYTEEALNSVNPDRREKYFVRRGDAYQVIPHLRKMIVFAPHDLLKDAPFTRLDMITCRNLLIYLQPAAQKKVLSLFHFSLKIGGIMFLGPSESPGDLADEFDNVDEHWKIYRKRRDVRLRPDFRLLLPAGPPLRMRSTPNYGATSSASDRLQQAVYERLLEEHMPPSFLINDRKELVHSFGGASKFLKLRDGRATPQFLDMIDSELRMILMGAIARADKHQTPVVFTGIRVRTASGEDSMTRLTVKPLNDRITGLMSFLIILEDMGQPVPPRDESTIDLGAASREQLQAMELELGHTRENLQAMIEEQESSNEELQATNEELVASNEQLQSTNEELHSVNEELYTVNAEYQHKIEELTQVTADLENLLLATDLAILFLDRNLCIRRFTPRIAQLFNLLPQDIGRSLTCFANLLNESMLDSLQQVLDGGQPVEKEIQDRLGNNYFMRILSYRISPSALDGVVLSLIDISALRRAEAHLRHLSAIVESSDDAIVGKDLEGTIISWNRGAETMYGYTADEVVGRSARVLYPTDAPEQFEAEVDSIRSGASVTGELQRQRKDGTVIDILHTVSPIRDTAGRTIGASGIGRDITVRKQAERDIKQAIRNRDQFLAMLSHELRNPLGAILNAAQLLDRGNLDHDHLKSAVRVVRRQADQMKLLLDDLLDVARVTQNKLVLRREPCRLRDVISEAIESIQPLLTARHQQLETKELKADPVVNGDHARLQQVMINLLKNAIKYSPPHSMIAISVEADHSQSVICVKDPGEGIPADMLERVFDLFVQSNHTLDRSDGGMGVGLTLVKTIVELHGGSVCARSDGHGQGSEFIVRLPLPPDNQRKPISDHTRTKPGRSFRIAIVEDNADSRTMLQSLLQLDGHEIRSAADGCQGLELIESWKPEVALIDIGLPGLDGFEVAQRLRTSGQQPPPHLVALTGYGFSSDREKALESGFDFHLVKPLKLTALNDVLTKIEESGNRSATTDQS